VEYLILRSDSLVAADDPLTLVEAVFILIVVADQLEETVFCSIIRGTMVRTPRK